jgi:hypothetical protein
MFIKARKFEPSETTTHLDEYIGQKSMDAGYYNISRGHAVGLCLRTDRKYDVKAHPECWSVYYIEEVPLARVDSDQNTCHKGECYGLNCWQVIKWCSFDMVDRWPIPMTNAEYSYHREVEDYPDE